MDRYYTILVRSERNGKSYNYEYQKLATGKIGRGRPKKDYTEIKEKIREDIIGKMSLHEIRKKYKVSMKIVNEVSKEMKN